MAELTKNYANSSEEGTDQLTGYKRYEKVKNFGLFFFENCKSWINSNKKLALLIVVLIALVNAPIVLILLHAEHKEIRTNTELTLNKPKSTVLHNSAISSQLNDISEKLANVETNLTKNKSYISVDQIRSELSQLVAQVDSVSRNSDKLISEQISKSTQKLQSQMQQIKQELTNLEEKKKHKKLISASNLPFQVMSIDNIEQSDVVTIHYDHHVSPLEVGDSLAGWKLVNTNFNNQTAEFKHNNQYAQIDLNQTNVGGR